MNDVVVFSIRSFSVWHRDKKPFFAIDNFDVVNDEAVVDCDGSHCFELSFFFGYKSYPNVCDFQVNLPSFFRFGF